MTYSETKAQAMQVFGQLVKMHPSDANYWKPERVRKTLCVDYFSFNMQAEQELSAPGNSKVFWEAVSTWSKKAIEKQQSQQQETINGYTKEELAEMWDKEMDALEETEEDDDEDDELTPVATGYIHEGQAYYEVWQGEEPLDGGLLLHTGGWCKEASEWMDFLQFCDSLGELGLGINDEEMPITADPDFEFDFEIKSNYFISSYCLAFHLKTTFNLIARCYCRISINATVEYVEIQEYYADKHVEAMEYSFKSSGLIPEALVHDASYSLNNNDNFFFRFIEATQVISHSVDLSFIDSFSKDFEGVFEVFNQPMVDIESGVLKVADFTDCQDLVCDLDADLASYKADMANGFDLAKVNQIRSSILPQW